MEEKIIPSLDTLLTADRIQVAYRVEINGDLIFSAQYGRVKKRNSYTIAYRDVNSVVRYGLQYYIIASDDLILALIQSLCPTATTYQGEFQLTTNAMNSVPGTAVPVKVDPNAPLVVTSVECIQQKCLLMDVGLLVKYVVSFPNTIRLD